jgi:uncharacterized protein YuzE
MRVHYYPETDSLYIDLADRPGVEVREAVPGVNLDLDEDGHLVGIDIDRASEIADLDRLQIEALPRNHLPSRQN